MSILSKWLGSIGGSKSPAPAPAPASPLTASTMTASSTGLPDPAKVGEMVTAAQANNKVPEYGDTLSSLNQTVAGLYGPNKALGEAGVSAFTSQIAAQKGAVENQNNALQLKYDTAQSEVQRMTALQQSVNQQAVTAVAAWNTVTDKADQFLTDTRADIGKATKVVTDFLDQYKEFNTTALANQIQSGVYGMLESIKGGIRSIAEHYGTNSPEYTQAMESKRTSIGAMVSDLTGKMWDKTQSLINTTAGAVASIQQQGLGSLEWSRKNAIDAATARETAKQQSVLSMANWNATMEVAKSSPYYQVADWVDQSGVVAMDVQPLLSQLLDLQQIGVASQPTNSWTMNVPASWSQGPTSGSGRRTT